jgi:hypothetical protein
MAATNSNPTPAISDHDILRTVVFFDAPDDLNIDKLSVSTREKHEAEVSKGFHPIRASWPTGQTVIMYCDPGTTLPQPGDVLAVYKQCMKLNGVSPPSSPTSTGTFLTHMVTLCWLNSHSDSSPREETLTVAELANRFSVPDTKRGKLSQAEYHALDQTDPAQNKLRKREKNGAAFIASTFGQPNVRTQLFVVEIHGFTLDFDGIKDGVPGVNRAEFEAKLAPFGYLAYTSYSHQSVNERWRVFIPYSVPCTVEQHAAVYAFFFVMFDGRLDDRSETTQQLWYTPACPHDAVGEFQSFVHDGALFDPYRVPPLVRSKAKSSQLNSQQSPTPSATDSTAAFSTAVPAHELDRLTHAMPFINADERTTWVKVGMALKNTYGDAALTLWKEWSKTSAKYDEDDAEATWSSFTHLAQGGVSLGTIFHLAKQGGYVNQLSLVNQSASSQSQPTAALAPLFDIQSAKVDRFVQNPAPPRRWLLHKTLPLGKVGMLVAPGGTGKSFLMIQLAVAVATHTLLADHWQVDSPGASLILCAEEDDEDLHHRLQDVLASTIAHTPASQQLIEQRVFIKSMLTEDNLMTHANDRGEIVLTDYVDRLALTAQQIPDLKLIIVDPASRFRGGNENAAQDTTRFVEALERLRSATDATVLLVHHTNKGSMNADEVNQGASRGSSALTDGVRWQMSLSKPSKKQATDAGVCIHNLNQYVLATITKNNGAPPQDPVLLLRGPGGVLGAVVKAASRTSPEVALIALIQSESVAKRSHTANSLEKRFSGTSGPLKLSAVALRRLIAKCVQLKYLRKRTTKPVNMLELTGNMPP